MFIIKLQDLIDKQRDLGEAIKAVSVNPSQMRGYVDVMFGHLVINDKDYDMLACRQADVKIIDGRVKK